MNKEITVVVKIILDEKHANAPSVDDVVTCVEAAVMTPDNDAYGIESIKVSGTESVALEDTNSSELFPLVVLYNDLLPIVKRYAIPSNDDDVSTCSVAVILNSFMAALVANNRMNDPFVLVNLAIVVGSFIAAARPHAKP